MYKLKDCYRFNFHVYEDNGKFYIGVHGLGFDNNTGKNFGVYKTKQFETMSQAMDFVNKNIDSDFEATEEDFLFFATRIVYFDYFSFGVDFDED